MNSLWDYVNNMFDNTHVRIKIYWEFLHGFIYIVNEGNHVRITFYPTRIYTDVEITGL
jgi:hypothetical protein